MSDGLLNATITGDIVMQAGRYGYGYGINTAEQFFVIGVAGRLIFFTYLNGALQVTIADADEFYVPEPRIYPGMYGAEVPHPDYTYP